MAKTRNDILEKGAIIQRDGETYAITPRIPCGMITDFNILRKIADVAEKYGAGAIKVTSSQRLAIIGLQEDDLDKVWADLGMEPGYASGMCIRSVKACPGTTWCRLGQQDSLELGMKLEERFAHLPMPNKLKISVSGCPMDCAEGRVRDIGIMGTKKGFRVSLGGSAGASPRLGEIIADGLSATEAEALVERVLNCYRESGAKKRLGAYIDAIGVDVFKKQVGV